MIQYARFSIECTSKRKEDKKIYYEIKEKLNSYLLNEDMELYRVPIETEEYIYACEHAMQYSWDWNRTDDRDDYPGLYVDKHENIETVYSKQDFDNAAAYLVNYWYFAYIYDEMNLGDFVEDCCCNLEWKYENGLVQNKPLLIPRSQFKKKYAKLNLGYALSEEVVDLLIEQNLAEKQDFWEIKDKHGQNVAYQIQPQHIIMGFAKDNNMHMVDKCNNCGLERYEYNGEPFYISEDLINSLHGLNRTKEVSGPVIFLHSITIRIFLFFLSFT